MKTEVSRAGLYDLVWRGPGAGKHFGVSDSTVEDICRASGIPFPPARYWERDAQRAKVRPAPVLPPRPYGGPEILAIGPEEPWRPPAHEEDIPLPPPLVFGETLAETKDRALREIGTVRTPRTLRNPHPIILRVLSAEGRRRKSAKDDGAKPSVPDDLEKRRRVLLNGLLHVLDGFGAGYVPGADLSELQVTIGRVHLACRLEEVFPPRPARRLGLSVIGLRKDFEPPHVWEDDDTGPLERRIADIAAGLVVCADALVREREQAHFQWAVTRRQELRDAPLKAERAKAELSEMGRLTRLWQHCSNFERSRQIRALISAAPDRPELDEWKVWALNEADKLDPLKLPRQHLTL